MAEHVPVPAGTRLGVRGIGPAALALFARPAGPQLRAVLAALDDEPADAVLAEAAFLGADLLANLPRAGRPAVLVLGVLPLTCGGPGLAPFGAGLPPATGALTRLRNAALGLLAQRVLLRGVERHLDAESRRSTGRPLPGEGFWDGPGRCDVFLQIGVPGLEHPRPGLERRVRFVGRPPAPPQPGPDPDRWPELDGRRVVHVTQGTEANADPTALLVPTAAALAEREDVLVVATAGGRPAAAVTGAVRARLGAVPANLRVETWLDYARLLPRTDLVVTNGGWGGVTSALAHGVPLVVAGDSEDEPEVAARVAWSGAGVDLRTARPSVPALRAAVRTALDGPDHAAAARRLRAQFDAVDGFAVLDAALREVLAGAGAR
ncbi:glycosyltransferase [Kineococcus gypseus]|uniref:glycosyltransferase n=1 Tax=Kineococcus gypseus TaxID=1637102 RepID=UPI003D7E9915